MIDLGDKDLPHWDFSQFSSSPSQAALPTKGQKRDEEKDHSYELKYVFVLEN